MGLETTKKINYQHLKIDCKIRFFFVTQLDDEGGKEGTATSS